MQRNGLAHWINYGLKYRSIRNCIGHHQCPMLIILKVISIKYGTLNHRTLHFGVWFVGLESAFMNSVPSVPAKQTETSNSGCSLTMSARHQPGRMHDGNYPCFYKAEGEPPSLLTCEMAETGTVYGGGFVMTRQITQTTSCRLDTK